MSEIFDTKRDHNFEKESGILPPFKIDNFTFIPVDIGLKELLKGPLFATTIEITKSGEIIFHGRIQLRSADEEWWL